MLAWIVAGVGAACRPAAARAVSMTASYDSAAYEKSASVAALVRLVAGVEARLEVVTRRRAPGMVPWAPVEGAGLEVGAVVGRVAVGHVDLAHVPALRTSSGTIDLVSSKARMTIASGLAAMAADTSDENVV